MQQKAISRLIRAVLIAAVLGIALVSSGTFHQSGCADARTCYEAMDDYFAATATYETARVSYFYDQPTTCQDDCTNSTDPYCYANCRTSRHTALGNAEIGMFNLAQDTCTPATIDQCDEARTMANGCYALYDLSQYATIEERLAVYPELSACLLASKIDTCQ